MEKLDGGFRVALTG